MLTPLCLMMKGKSIRDEVGVNISGDEGYGVFEKKLTKVREHLEEEYPDAKKDIDYDVPGMWEFIDRVCSVIDKKMYNLRHLLVQKETLSTEDIGDVERNISDVVYLVQLLEAEDEDTINSFIDSLAKARQNFEKWFEAFEKFKKIESEQIDIAWRG